MKTPWDNWAKKYGASAKATTPNPNIKRIEIAALAKFIKPGSSVMEVGCGNAINLLSLYDMIPGLKLSGCDNSVEMLDAAYSASFNKAHVELFCADITTNSFPTAPKYDYVICDRVLINIKNKAKRQQVIENMKKMLKDDGRILMIENFTQSYANQNRLRRSVGLKSRKWPPFNKFLDWNELRRMMGSMNCTVKRNISSLHDILLYVILPKVDPKHDGPGKWDYENPIMNTLTDLIIENRLAVSGDYGQNMLMVWSKG